MKPFIAAQSTMAITENRLQNAIKTGENRGKLLRHDFVVGEFRLWMRRCVPGLSVLFR